MADRAESVSVFVSSTFRDMQAERDHLVTVVFPELRERLAWLGLEFFDVDLRWGVPETGMDGETANSWAYCKQWIERVEPFFICILGERYGWIPRPEEIYHERDRARWNALSITEMEIRLAVLEDEDLHRRSFFYLRDTIVPAETPDSIYREFVQKERAIALGALKQAIRNCDRPVRDYPCTWAGDRFSELDRFGDQVIEDLWSGVLRDTRYVSKEVWRVVRGKDADQDPLYYDESEPIPEYIWHQLVNHARPEPADPLEAEAKQMRAFGEGRLRWFTGRSHELDELTQFVQSGSHPGSSRLCVVKAIAGQGKTSLLARFSQELEAASYRVITHFIGATEGSGDVRRLLLRLHRELDRFEVAVDDPVGEGDDQVVLSEMLADRLKIYSDDIPLILLIDGLNQLTSGHNLRWLPRELGSGVRIVVSCIDDPMAGDISLESQVLSSLHSRSTAPKWIDLEPLNESDVREIVIEYLREYCKELAAEPLDQICSMSRAHNPLYLLVMLGELRLLGGSDINLRVPEIIAELEIRYPDTVSLFQWVLGRLEVFGAELVGLWCGYLALGRQGMSSSELRDLLERVHAEKGTKMAARIERGLRRYLRKRGSRLDFSHSELYIAVRNRYLNVEATDFHSQLSEFFGSRWGGGDRHALSEFPYHLKEAGQFDSLQRLLFDTRFLGQKIRTLGPQAAIEDFELALAEAAGEELDRNALRVLHHALRLAATTLAADPDQLPGQLHGRLGGNENPKIRMLLDTPAKWRAWLRPQMRSLAAAEGPRVRTLSLGSHWIDDVALLAGGDRALILAEGELAVLDVTTGRYLESLSRDQEAVGAVALHPDFGRVFIAMGARLTEWDPEALVQYRELGSHREQIKSISLSADGRRAISRSEHETKVWDTENATLKIAHAHRNLEVASAAVSGDGETIAVLDRAGLLQTFTNRTGKLGVQLRVFERESSSGAGLELSADGAEAIVFRTSSVALVDLRRKRVRARLENMKVEVVTATLFDQGRAILGLVTARQKGLDDEMAAAIAGEGPMPDLAGAILMNFSVWDCGTNTLHTTHTDIDASLLVCVASNGSSAIYRTEVGGLEFLDLVTGDRRTIPGSAETGCITTTGRFAAFQESSSIALWDLSQELCVGRLDDIHGVLRAMAYSEQGLRVVVESEKHGLELWSLDTPMVPRLLGFFDNIIWSIGISVDGSHLVASSGDQLRVWNLDEATECILDIEAPPSPASTRDRCLGLSPDGKLALSAGIDRAVTLWEVESGCVLRHLDHENFVDCLVFTPDGRRALIGSSGIKTPGNITLWDVTKGTKVWSREAHDSSVYAICVTQDGSRFFSSSADHSVRVWSLEDGKCQSTLTGHDGLICALACLPEGEILVSGDSGGNLVIWDPSQTPSERRQPGHPTRVTTVAVSPDGRYVASTATDKSLTFWQVVGSGAWGFDSLEPIHKTATSVRATRSGVSADGSQLVLGYTTNRGDDPGQSDTHTIIGGTSSESLPIAEVFDLATGESVLRLWDADASMTAPVYGLAVFNGRVAAASGRVAVWNLSSGRIMATCEESFVSAMAWKPSSQKLLMAMHSAIQEVDLGSGSEPRPVGRDREEIVDLVIAEDERTAISRSVKAELHVWQLDEDADPRRLEDPLGHRPFDTVSESVRSFQRGQKLAMWPDGLVVSTTAEKTVSIWDANTGRALCGLTLDTAPTAIAVAEVLAIVGDAEGRIHLLELGGDLEATRREEAERPLRPPIPTPRRKGLNVPARETEDRDVDAPQSFPDALGFDLAQMDAVKNLAVQHLSNGDQLYDQSVSHNNIGDTLRAQGDLPGALAAYRAGMENAERLAASDPSNADWQRDLEASYNNIGNVLRAQSDVAGAWAAYRAGLEIAERLAASDPLNAALQRSLVISNVNLAEFFESVCGFPNGVRAVIWRLFTSRIFRAQAAARWKRCHQTLSFMKAAGMNLDPPLVRILEQLDQNMYKRSPNLWQKWFMKFLRYFKP